MRTNQLPTFPNGASVNYSGCDIFSCGDYIDPHVANGLCSAARNLPINAMTLVKTEYIDKEGCKQVVLQPVPVSALPNFRAHAA